MSFALGAAASHAWPAIRSGCYRRPAALRGRAAMAKPKLDPAQRPSAGGVASSTAARPQAAPRAARPRIFATGIAACPRRCNLSAASQLKDFAASRPGSGCFLRCPPVSRNHSAHSLEICMRAAFCASSSQRLLSACEACPLVHSHLIRWRAVSSSSSCHRS